MGLRESGLLQDETETLATMKQKLSDREQMGEMFMEKNGNKRNGDLNHRY